MQLADIQGGRAPGTSSANPVKLRRYSQDGLELVTALQAKARAVVDTIHSLDAQGYPRSVGDVHVRFRDLAADWYHLDEFAGDVADGFFRASGPGQSLDGLVGMDDAQLAQLGRLGYADRDQAINEAHRLAGELDRLRRGERVNVRDLFNAIRRAQYDPAFAVTFSERIGVRGYVEAAAMLRGLYEQPSGDVSAEGVDALRALSGTLTTALDTLPGTPEADRHDPGNARLLDGQRLSFGFVRDLTSGYQPDPTATQRFGSPANEHDLAALIGFTAPPTVVAVAIANSRMRQRLTAYNDEADTYALAPNAWGRHGGLVSAYAGMLSRNDDAAALFLSGDGVLEGALRRHDAYYLDGGAAVGDLVESALTHEDPGTREPLMHRAITEVARSGEINGPHLVDALTAGVDANMSVIDERINAPFDYDETDRPDAVVAEYQDTHDFLREVMRDPEAALAVHESVNDFGREQVGSLPGGDAREARLRELGRVQALVTAAEENAGVGSAIDEMMASSPLGPTPGNATNYAVSWIPVAGQINDIAGSMGVGAGNWLDHVLGSDFDALPEAEQQARVQRAQDRLERASWLMTDRYESNTPAGAQLRASTRGEPFVNPDGSIKAWDSMNQDQRQAYREWVYDGVGNDSHQGPFYTDDGDIKAGALDVTEGETDVSNRR